MEMTDEHILQLIRHAKEDPEYYTQTLQILEGQRALLEGDEYVNTGLLDHMSAAELLSIGEFYLKEEPGFPSNTYSIGVRPQYLEITMENDNGTVYINDEAFMQVSNAEQTKTAGPLFLGEYDIRFTTTFDYANQEVTETETVSLFGVEPTTQLTKRVTGDHVELKSGLQEVQIYVNDQPTPFTITDGNVTTSFYPAVADGSQTVYGVAAFPWGEAKSEPVTITDLEQTYDVTPQLSIETKDEILAFAQSFLEARARAYGSKDTSEVEKLYPYHDGDLLQRIEYELGDLYFAGARDTTLDSVKLLRIEFNTDKYDQIKVSFNKELNTYMVRVNFMKPYYELHLSDGRVSDRNNSEIMDLWIIYEHGQWVVYDMSVV